MAPCVHRSPPAAIRTSTAVMRACMCPPNMYVSDARAARGTTRPLGSGVPGLRPHCDSGDRLVDCQPGCNTECQAYDNSVGKRVPDRRDNGPLVSYVVRQRLTGFQCIS